MRSVIPLRSLYGKPWSKPQVWRLIAKGILPAPFYVADCKLALVYADEFEAAIERAKRPAKAAA